MKIASSSKYSFCLAAACLLLAGCGKSGLELFPVHGRVTLDGQPLADAGVMFLAGDNGPSASGTTNSDGVFELMTVNAVGAIGGKHDVAIAKRKYVGVKPGEPPAPGGLRVEWYSPKKYANPSTSGFSAEVSAEDNEFNFDLTSK